jgi:curved DNA-binding protein CbpA
MQLPDYYAILRVSPTADSETIWRAYRDRARQCHPDHGGSHAQMVALNEAWYVLKDTARRSEYDQARLASASGEAQEVAAETSRRAKEAAEQYPRDWSTFNAWMDSVNADFARAKFGHTRGPMGVPFPTVSDSISAAIFITVGGAMGALAAIVLVIAVVGMPTNFYTIKGTGFFVLLAAALGAGAGQLIHKAVASILPSHQSAVPPPQSPPADQGSQIVRCNSCGQQLRFPKSSQTIRATCAKCRNTFDIEPS